MTWKGHNALHGVDRSKSVVRSLRVVKREDLNVPTLPSNVALVRRTDLTAELLDGSTSPLLFARTHAQFLCKLEESELVEAGGIALDQVSRYNFEVTDGDEFDWTLYDPEQHDDKVPPVLDYVVFQVRPVKPFSKHCVISSAALRKWIRNSLWRSTITSLERFVIPLDMIRSAQTKSDNITRATGAETVTQRTATTGEAATNSTGTTGEAVTQCTGTTAEAVTQSTADEYTTSNTVHESMDILIRCVELEPVQQEEEEEEATDVNGDTDCRRGVIDESTKVYLCHDEAPLTRPTFNLDCTDKIPDRKDEANTDPRYIDIQCEDEMWFPVRKAILQPCVALTKSVRSDVRETVHVEIDCCTFDRVLLFLIAEANGKGDEYELNAEIVSQLLSASKKLGLMRLERMCNEFLGQFESRVRSEGWRWDEIVARNSSGSGEVIVVIDGMVFDLGRWIHHHPGGDTIIPGQALNIDATVFFEVYHSSRASFRYLRSFYTGDVVAQDVEKIPPAQGTPSDGFLSTLRSYTSPWRKIPIEKIHDSF